MQRLSFFRFGSFHALICTLAVMLSISSARAAESVDDVLRYLPKEVEVAVVIPDVARLVNGVQDMAELLMMNMGQPTEDLNFMRDMKREIGLEQGIDDDGAIVVMVKQLQMAIMGQMQEPPVIALVPITDHEAFVSNFAPTQETQHAGIRRGQLPDDTRPTFIREMDGKYAAISQSIEALLAYEPGDDQSAQNHAAKIGTNAQHYFNSGIFVYGDMDVMGDALRPVLSGAITQWQIQLEKMNQDMPHAPQMRSLSKLLMTTLSQMSDKFLAQSQSLCIAGNVTSAGFDLGITMQFDPESDLHAIYAQTPAQPITFSRLPAKPYLQLSTANYAHMPIERLNDFIISAMPSDGELDETSRPVADLIREVLSLYELDQMQSATYMPEDMTDEDVPLFQMVYVLEPRGPAPAYHQQVQQMYEKFIKVIAETMLAFEQMPADAAQGDADNPQQQIEQVIEQFVTYEPQSQTIGGVNFDVMTLNMMSDHDQLSPEQRRDVRQMQRRMYGTVSPEILLAQMSNVFVAGLGPDALFQELITLQGAADANVIGGPDVSAIREHFPPNRFAEGYLSLSSYMNFYMTLMTMEMPEGQQIQANIPEVPPLGWSMSNADGGISYHSHMSVKSIEGMGSMVQMIMMGMFGGMGGGGGAMGPGAPPAGGL